MGVVSKDLHPTSMFNKEIKMKAMNRLVALFLVVISMTLPCTVFAALVWSDDFEGYSVGGFPSPSWTYSGNSDITINNSVVTQGSKSLRVHNHPGSCWEAVAHRQVGISTSEGFLLEFYVYNGTDYQYIYNCNPWQAYVSLNTGDSWSSSLTGLIMFYEDGTVKDRAFTSSLQSYSQALWYKVKIKYMRKDTDTVTITYWINDEFKTTNDYLAQSYENDLVYISFHSGNSSVWFDDIKVSDLENDPPIIKSLTAKPKAGRPTLTVVFKCTAKDTDGTIAEYRWDFGDGDDNVTTKGTTSHNYVGMGTFNAKVTVVDNDGYETTSKVIPIKVCNGPDLTGKIEQLTFNEVNHKVIMKLRVSNEGDWPAGPFNISCHLSDDGTTPIVPAFKVIRADSGIKAEKSVIRIVDQQFDSSVYGKYFLIYIDPNKEVDEIDDTNNGIRLVVQSMTTE